MKLDFRLWAILPFLLAPGPAGAVDDSAANLVAEGRISLSRMIDTLNRKYPKGREFFWNVSGIAYHDFSGAPQGDVIVGLSGYRDVGRKYNNDRQLVEDAGAGFAYFRSEKGEWKLSQVEVVEGKRYEGFEGADLLGSGKDQLVVYSGTGEREWATVYAVRKNGSFEKVATVAGQELGPRVAREPGKPRLVDYQRALVNRCDDCGIYYGRPYDWDGRAFVEQSDDFLDHVRAYDPFHSTEAETSLSLAYFESYLSGHPADFCALANCYDLSNRLGLAEKADAYRRRLARWAGGSVDCKYCDEWTAEKNKANAQQYLEQVTGKKDRKKPLAKIFGF